MFLQFNIILHFGGYFYAFTGEILTSPWSSDLEHIVYLYEKFSFEILPMCIVFVTEDEWML